MSRKDGLFEVDGPRPASPLAPDEPSKEEERLDWPEARPPRVVCARDADDEKDDEDRDYFADDEDDDDDFDDDLDDDLDEDDDDEDDDL